MTVCTMKADSLELNGSLWPQKNSANLFEFLGVKKSHYAKEQNDQYFQILLFVHLSTLWRVARVHVYTFDKKMGSKSEAKSVKIKDQTSTFFLAVSSSMVLAIKTTFNSPRQLKRNLSPSRSHLLALRRRTKTAGSYSNRCRKQTRPKL